MLRNADQAKNVQNRAYLGTFQTAKAVLAVEERVSGPESSLRKPFCSPVTGVG